MHRYNYKAIDKKGRSVSGQLEASNEIDLEQRLATMELILFSYKKINYRQKSSFVFKRKISRRELINFSFQLEQLLSSGVPIIQAIDDLRDSEENSFFKGALHNTSERIKGGSSLAQAMAANGTVFNRVYVFMVKIGEQSGQLPQVLQELAQMLKWQDEIIARSKAVSIYPAIVFVFIAIAATFLMVYLVPQLIPFFKNNNVELPFYTKALIATSNFISAYGLYVLLLLLAFFIVAAIANKSSDKFSFWLDKLALQLWFVGPINKKIKLARFAKHMSLMYMSGVSVLEGLKLARSVMNNKVLNDSVDRARNLIKNGASVSAGFAGVDLFPPLVVRMLQVGETSGSLDKALVNISYFYERDAKEAIERLEPVIMPLLTVFLAGLLLWIMASVLFPIYGALGEVTSF